ncbi:MAG: cadherin-like beta sandwich domain-containing protein [Nitrospira sp. LK70]|nr:cadherin-like beta sandwich domain-containing protein [Nitrospira sp. LK70]
MKNEAGEGLNRRVLFPVILEEVKIPLEFRRVQGARLIDWQPDQKHHGFDQFLNDLARVIGAPVTQIQASPALSAKPTPEHEIGPLPGVVRALGGNNNLSALTVLPGTLVPAFAASTTEYTVNVASDVTSVKVSATKADSNAVLPADVSAGSGTATGQATMSGLLRHNASVYRPGFYWPRISTLMWRCPRRMRYR